MAPEDFDAATAYSFSLEIDGIACLHLTEVSGLKIEHDVIEMKMNEAQKGKYIIRKMPGRPKAGEITIKRYFYAHDSFKEWMDKVGLGQVKAARKNGFVNILDTEGNTLKRFQFTNGMAKSLDLGSLQAGSTNPVTETLVIAFETLELVS